MPKPQASDKPQDEQILSGLKRHPRIVYQQFAEDEEARKLLQATLPQLVPYGAKDFAGFLPVLDWDHRLPSHHGIIRIYAYYSTATIKQGESEFATRQQLIADRDKFPEFDVPDFAGLLADESYEGEVDNTGAITKVRLVSNWRREIGFMDARAAIRIARRADEYKRISAEMRGRPDFLGDLEAVSLVPPCESSHTNWVVDVWYLTHLDASVGKGHSFLVDLEDRKVVSVRDFVVRPS